MISMVLVAVTLSLASARASTEMAAETDEAKFVRLSHELEREPLSDTDKTKRTWLLTWATQSSDFEVVICDLLGPIPGTELAYGGELLTQMLFGNAAFQIANPERRGDIVAAQLAGVRSAMAAYQSIVAADPAARIPYFDQLHQQEQAGELETHMAPTIIEQCQPSTGDQGSR